MANPNPFVLSTACVDGVASASAPTLVTQGQEIGGASAVRVSVEADEDKMLGATGTLACFMWHPGTAAWLQVPALNLSVSGNGRGQVFPDVELPVTVPGFRAIWVPQGVEVDEGGTTDVTVRQHAQVAR